MDKVLLKQAREWLEDIFPDDDIEISEATENTILWNIEIHYAGGVDAFINDGKITEK